MSAPWAPELTSSQTLAGQAPSSAAAQGRPTCTHPPRFQEGLRAQPAPTPQRPGWHHLLGGPQAAGRAVMSPCGGNHGNSSGSHSVRRGGTNPGCEGQRGGPPPGGASLPAEWDAGDTLAPHGPPTGKSSAPHSTHPPASIPSTCKCRHFTRVTRCRLPLTREAQRLHR